MPVKLFPKDQWTVIKSVDGKVCLPMTVDNEPTQWCGPVGEKEICVIGIREDGNNIYADCSIVDRVSVQDGGFVVNVPPATPPQIAVAAPQQDIRANVYTVAGNSVGAAYSVSGVSLPLWGQVGLNIAVWAAVLLLAAKFLIPWLREWKTATSAAYGTQFKRPRSLRNRIEFEEVDLQ